MRYEFDELFQKAKKTIDVNKPTDEEYKAIEYVYTWHPSISNVKGKEQIVWIYCNLGMRGIYDMYGSAVTMENLDNRLRSAQARVKAIEEEIDNLKKGVNSDEED